MGLALSTARAAADILDGTQRTHNLPGPVSFTVQHHDRAPALYGTSLSLCMAAAEDVVPWADALGLAVESSTTGTGEQHTSAYGNVLDARVSVFHIGRVGVRA
jgi:hypothetical protein